MTTTAIATAAAPAGDAAATTCATSCTLPPAIRPISPPDKPSPTSTAGSANIEIVPKTVTIATPVATSSSSRSTTLSIAATADAPQIENPVATSIDNPRGTPISRPINSVPRNVRPTISSTATTVPAPRPSTCVTDSCKPSSTTPTRSSFFVDHAMPGRAAAGKPGTLPITMPRTTAAVSALTAGTSPEITIDTTIATAVTASPGHNTALPASVRCEFTVFVTKPRLASPAPTQ